MNSAEYITFLLERHSHLLEQKYYETAIEIFPDITENLFTNLISLKELYIQIGQWYHDNHLLHEFIKICERLVLTKKTPNLSHNAILDEFFKLYKYCTELFNTKSFRHNYIKSHLDIGNVTSKI